METLILNNLCYCDVFVVSIGLFTTSGRFNRLLCDCVSVRFRKFRQVPTQPAPSL